MFMLLHVFLAALSLSCPIIEKKRDLAGLSQTTWERRKSESWRARDKFACRDDRSALEGGHLLSLTKSCSAEKNVWTANNLLCKNNEAYNCVLVNRSTLSEMCMKVRAIISTTGCPYFDFRTDPTFKDDPKFFPCPSNTTGCPDAKSTVFLSSDLYEYAACIEGKHESTTRISSEMQSTLSSTSFYQFREEKHEVRRTVEGRETTLSDTPGTTVKTLPHIYLSLPQAALTTKGEKNALSTTTPLQTQSDLQVIGETSEDKLFVVIGGAVSFVVLMNVCFCGCIYLKIRKIKTCVKTPIQGKRRQEKVESDVEQIYDDIGDVERSASESSMSYLEPVQQRLKCLLEVEKYNFEAHPTENESLSTEPTGQGNTNEFRNEPYEKLDLFEAIAEREKSASEDYEKIKNARHQVTDLEATELDLEETELDPIHLSM